MGEWGDLVLTSCSRKQLGMLDFSVLCSVIFRLLLKSLEMPNACDLALPYTKAVKVQERPQS